MRLLYIMPYYTTPASAWNIRSYNLTQHFIKRGWSVHVLTTPTWLNLSKEQILDKSPIMIDKVHVHIINVRYSQTMSLPRRAVSFFIFLIIATLKGFTIPRPNVVLASSGPLTVAVPGIINSFWHRCPFVFEIRDLWPEQSIDLGLVRNTFVVWTLKLLAKYAYKRASLIIAFSPEIRDRVLANYDVPDDRVVIIGNCSDINIFDPHASGSSFREKYGLDGCFLVMHTGTMGFINGLDYVLKVAKIIEDKDFSTRFVLVGEGSMKPNLIKETEELGLKSVMFLNQIPKKEIPATLAASDLCMMIVKNNKTMEMNSASKFFDYLAAGRPVLLNYGGWQKDLLDQWEAGLAAPGDDPNVFAKFVLQMKEDCKLRTKMGINARKLAEIKFDCQKLMERLFDMVDNVARGKSPSSKSNTKDIF